MSTNPLEIATLTKGEPSNTGFVKPSTTPVAHDRPAEPFGAVCNLPLPLEVTFRRKLLAIAALQLSVVAVVTGLLETSTAVKDAIRDHVVSAFGAIAGVVVGLLATLALLYRLRVKHPFNWIALALFSMVVIVGMLTIDVALASHSTVVNCAFTWLSLTIRIVLSGWTKKPTTLDPEGTMHSLYLPALVGGGVSAIVFAVAGGLIDGLFTDSIEIAVSITVQMCILVWFCHEIDGMHKVMSPDQYMRGVIYLYADTIVMVAMVGLCFIAADGSEKRLSPPLSTRRTRALAIAKHKTLDGCNGCASACMMST